MKKSKRKRIHIKLTGNENECYISKGKKLTGVILYDLSARVMELPLSEIWKLEIDNIALFNNGWYYGYEKSYFCSKFRLCVKKQALIECSRERLMTLPDIDCVELLYENYPSDFYFLPCELADNTEQLIYEKRFENGFDDVYSNNLCQRVREYNQADGYLELSITKSNMTNNNKN